MKLLIICILILSPLFVHCQFSDEEIKHNIIEFNNKIISNPDNLDSILQNESTIRTNLVLDIEYSEYLLKSYSSIIKAQIRNNFFLTDYIVQQNSLVILVYKKKDNLFYNFYSFFFGDDCTNRIEYIYSVIENEIYFKSINICQHQDASILDK